MLCYGKEMASILLPIRAWEAKKILLSDEVYKRSGDHPPPLSQSAKYHQTDNTFVLEEQTQEDNEADHDHLLRIVSHLKVLTNEKRGGLKVVAFDKSPFKLLTLRFSTKSVQAPSCRRPKTTHRNLFLSFEINNCFPVAV